MAVACSQPAQVRDLH